MKKQLLFLVMMLLPMIAHADENGTCGENLTWTLNESTGTLTIEGSGSMEDYGYESSPFFWSRGHISTVVISDGVTTIGAWAFYGCSGLTAVTIPNSVTNIGDNAFSYCSGLISIEVESGNTKYDSRNNCNAIIETASNTLIAGCKNTIIPKSVTSIGDWAFEECSGLTSVEIPNSVTSIGEYAFRYCTGLTSVTIPNSVTSIGDEAFRFCDLTTLTVYAPSCSLGTYALHTNALDNIYVFSDKVDDYKAATNWSKYASRIKAITDVTVSGVTTRQNPEKTTDYWCTYYHPQANVKINTASVQMFKASLNGDNLTLTEVEGNVIKAGQAVVLKATAGGALDMELTSSASTGDFSGNELKGTSVEITGAAGNIYVLNAIAGKGAGFYKLKTEGTIGANKAYLTYDGVGAPEYFGFGETTSLSEELRAKSEEFATAPVYDLQGRRISQPVKGLYIVNGKKIVVK